jgi:hypothetical protein
MKKKFACYWGEGYIVCNIGPKKAMFCKHKLSWFTSDNGYDENDIECIRMLAIGEAYMPDALEIHSIVRIR